MSSMLKKINKKQNLNFSMGIKFLCPKCGNTKLIPQSTFQCKCQYFNVQKWEFKYVQKWE